MLKEIHEQPAALGDTLPAGCPTTARRPGEIDLDVELLKRLRRVLISPAAPPTMPA